MENISDVIKFSSTSQEGAFSAYRNVLSNEIRTGSFSAKRYKQTWEQLCSAYRRALTDAKLTPVGKKKLLSATHQWTSLVDLLWNHLDKLRETFLAEAMTMLITECDSYSDWAPIIAKKVKGLLADALHRDSLKCPNLHETIKAAYNVLLNDSAKSFYTDAARIVGYVMIAPDYHLAMDSTIHKIHFKFFKDYWHEATSMDYTATCTLMAAMVHFCMEIAPRFWFEAFNLCQQVFLDVLDRWNQRPLVDYCTLSTFYRMTLVLADGVRRVNPTLTQEFDQKLIPQLWFKLQEIFTKKDVSLDDADLDLDSFVPLATDLPMGRSFKHLHVKDVGNWHVYSLAGQVFVHQSIHGRVNFDVSSKTNILVLAMAYRMGLSIATPPSILENLFTMMMHSSQENQIWASICLACHIHGKNPDLDRDWYKLVNAGLSSLQNPNKASSFFSLARSILVHCPPHADTLMLAESLFKIQLDVNPVQSHGAILKLRALIVFALYRTLDLVHVPSNLIGNSIKQFLQDLFNIYKSLRDMGNSTQVLLKVLDDVNLTECFQWLQGKVEIPLHRHVVRPLDRITFSDGACWEVRLRDLHDVFVTMWQLEKPSLDKQVTTVVAKAADGFQRMVKKYATNFYNDIKQVNEVSQSELSQQISQVEQLLDVLRIHVELYAGLSSQVSAKTLAGWIQTKSHTALESVVTKLSKPRGEVLSSDATWSVLGRLLNLLKASKLPLVYQFVHETMCADHNISDNHLNTLSRAMLEQLIKTISGILTVVEEAKVDRKRKRSSSDDEMDGDFMILNDDTPRPTQTSRHGEVLIQEHFGITSDPVTLCNHIGLIQVLAKTIVLVAQSSQPSDRKSQWFNNIPQAKFEAVDSIAANAEMARVLEASLYTELSHVTMLDEMVASCRGPLKSTVQLIEAYCWSGCRTLELMGEAVDGTIFSGIIGTVQSGKITNWKIGLQMVNLAVKLCTTFPGQSQEAIKTLLECVWDNYHIRLCLAYGIGEIYSSMFSKRLSCQELDSDFLEARGQLVVADGVHHGTMDHVATACVLMCNAALCQTSLSSKVLSNMLTISKRSEPAHVVIDNFLSQFAKKMGYPTSLDLLNDCTGAILSNSLAESNDALKDFPIEFWKRDLKTFAVENLSLISSRMVPDYVDQLQSLQNLVEMPTTRILQKSLSSAVPNFVLRSFAENMGLSLDRLDQSMLHQFAPGSNKQTLSTWLQDETTMSEMICNIILTCSGLGNTKGLIADSHWRSRDSVIRKLSSNAKPAVATIRSPLYSFAIVAKTISYLMSRWLNILNLDQLFTSHYTLNLIETIADMADNCVVLQEKTRLIELISIVLILSGDNVKSDNVVYGSITNILTIFCTTKGFSALPLTYLGSLAIENGVLAKIWSRCLLPVTLEWIQSKSDSLSTFLTTLPVLKLDQNTLTQCINLVSTVNSREAMEIKNGLSRLHTNKDSLADLIPDKTSGSDAIVVGLQTVVEKLTDAEIWESEQAQSSLLDKKVYEIAMDPLAPDVLSIAATQAMAACTPSIESKRVDRMCVITGTQPKQNEVLYLIFSHIVQKLLNIVMAGQIKHSRMARDALLKLFQQFAKLKVVVSRLSCSKELGHFISSDPLPYIPPEQRPFEGLPSSENIRHDEWLCETASCLVYAHWTPITQVLLPLLHTNVQFADDMIPYLLLFIIVEKNQKNIGNLSRALQAFFAKWESMTVASLMVWINALLFVRTSPTPEVPVKTMRNFFLPSLSYETLARAAIKTKMYTTALYFAEVSVENTGSKHVPNDCFRDGSLTSSQVELFKDILQVLEPSDYDVLNNSSGMQSFSDKLRREGNWDKYLMLQDSMELDVKPRNTGIAQSLAGLGLYNTLYGFVQQDASQDAMMYDLQCQAAWKNSQWSLEYPPTGVSGANCTLFALLKSLHSKDQHHLETWLQQGYRDIHVELLSLSPDASSDRERLFGRLLAVKEIEEMARVYFDVPLDLVESVHSVQTNLSQEGVLELWNQRANRLEKKSMFGNLQSALNVRSKVLGIVDPQGDYRWKTMIHLAKLEGDVGSASDVLNVLQSLRQSYPTLPHEAELQLLMEEGKAMWKMGAYDMAINLLRVGLSRVPRSTPGRSTAMGLVGRWIGTQRSEPTVKVIDNWLIKAAEAGSPAERAEASYLLAEFADKRLESLSQELSGLQVLYNHKSQEIQELKRKIGTFNRKTPKEEVVKSEGTLRTLNKQLKLDAEKMNDLTQQRNRLLENAGTYYLKAIELHIPKDCYRFLALWSSRNDVAPMVSSLIKTVPTYKFVEVVSQICAMIKPLSQASDDVNSLTYQKDLRVLLQRLCFDFPHHCLPPVMAMITDISEAPEAHDLADKCGFQVIVDKVRVKHRDLVKEYDEYFDYAIALIRTGENVSRSSFEQLANWKRVAILTALPPPTPDPKDYQVVTIQSVSYERILNGLSKPHLISCVGTDGRVYKQVFKGKDDVRQDAFLMVVLRKAHDILKGNASTRSLGIRTYNVVPLHNFFDSNADLFHAGILQFVDNSVPLNLPCVDAHKLFFKDEDVARLQSDFVAAQSDPVQRARFFANLPNRYHPTIRHYFMHVTNDPHRWFEMIQAFTRSNAAMSIVGWVLGLGDRHLSNILVDSSNGELVHIDFGVTFESGKLLQLPEMIPFRLTRCIEDAMGVTGAEGQFKTLCEKVLTVLRTDEAKDIILTALNVLRFQPVGVAKAKTTTENPILMALEGGAEAYRSIEIAKQKLSREGESVTCKVNELIQIARDPEVLSLMWKGWSPYI